MRNVQVCTQLVCHAVHKTKRGGIEGNARKASRDVHLAARVRVVVIGIGANEELTADLYGLFRKRTGKFVVIGADVGFDRVGHDVHAGIRRNGCGYGFD